MSRPFRVMSYFSSYCRGMRSLQMRSRLENVELYIDYYKLYLFSLPRYWSIVAIRRDTGIIHHSLIIAIFIYRIKSFKQMLSGLIFWEIPLRKILPHTPETMKCLWRLRKQVCHHTGRWSSMFDTVEKHPKCYQIMRSFYAAVLLLRKFYRNNNVAYRSFELREVLDCSCLEFARKLEYWYSRKGC